VHFITEPVNLLDSRQVFALIAMLRQVPGPLVLIVIDTLSRCMPGGDENSPKDMGAAVAAIDRLRVTFGSHALVLHHTARDTDRERGHTSLRGAADTMIALRA